MTEGSARRSPTEEAVAIVMALAEHMPYDEMWCAFCGDKKDGPHDSDCLYRRAREWVQPS